MSYLFYNTLGAGLFALSVVLVWCVKEWGWMESNPTNRIRRFKENPGRVPAQLFESVISPMQS